MADLEDHGWVSDGSIMCNIMTIMSVGELRNAGVLIHLLCVLEATRRVRMHNFIEQIRPFIKSPRLSSLLLSLPAEDDEEQGEGGESDQQIHTNKQLRFFSQTRGTLPREPKPHGYRRNGNVHFHVVVGAALTLQLRLSLHHQLKCMFLLSNSSKCRVIICF